MARHVITKVDELEVGKSKLVKVAGRDIALFNVKGEFFAIANRCPHEGADLCRGQVVGLAESDEPGKYRMTRHGEARPLPLARLGIRHPHREILVRSGAHPRQELRRVRRQGRSA